MLAFVLQQISQLSCNDANDCQACLHYVDTRVDEHAIVLPIVVSHATFG